MNTRFEKTRKKGSCTAEAAIVLPVLILLVIVIMYALVSFVNTPDVFENTDLTGEIRKVDSMKRKADIVFETLFE